MEILDICEIPKITCCIKHVNDESWFLPWGLCCERWGHKWDELWRSRQPRVFTKMSFISDSQLIGVYNEVLLGKTVELKVETDLYSLERRSVVFPAALRFLSAVWMLDLSVFCVLGCECDACLAPCCQISALFYCYVDQCPDTINSCICLVHFSQYYTAKTVWVSCLNTSCTCAQIKQQLLTN